MRLVSFAQGFGRVEGDTVIRMGSDILAYLSGVETAKDGPVHPLADLPLLAPVPRPGKIVCIGLNYWDHVRETGSTAPTEPPIFAKFANSVIGPGQAIVIPHLTAQADYEAELVVVIGSRTKAVPAGRALDHVAGYACGNDVSARDLQTSNQQWTRGKAIDTFFPVGPWLVTADEVPDPQVLSISCDVSGERLQASNTSEMIWSVAELVSILSQTMTLEPGDLISTGTPPGVGAAQRPPRFLRDGDVVTVSIDRIGALSNPVRADVVPVVADLA